MYHEIILSAGNLTVGICPAGGGSISRFFWADGASTVELMRSADKVAIAEALAGDPRGMASFPLVPFSGRIASGRYTFEGREFLLPPNFPPEPHAIHGDGWKAPWKVESTTPNSLDLSFAHEDPKNGIRYTAAQTFSISDTALEVKMSITNTGDTNIPVGLGLHPAFVKTPKATLTAGVTGVWLSDKLQLPTHVAPIPDEWDFSIGRVMSELIIDNNFADWDRSAKIRWPEWDTTVEIKSSPELGKLVVFCPSGEDFFCVEPVSNVADGFNLRNNDVEGTGTHILVPNETYSGTVRFTASVGREKPVF